MLNTDIEFNLKRTRHGALEFKKCIHHQSWKRKIKRSSERRGINVATWASNFLEHVSTSQAVWSSTYTKYTNYTKFTETKDIYKHFISFLVFENVENLFLITFSANQWLGWSLSNRGDEVTMCHFKEIDFRLENIFGGHRGS